MEEEPKVIGLFGEDFLEEAWKKEWWDMPEFIQEDAPPFQSVIVHFECEEDRDEFAKLLDQQITSLTKSMWFPKYNREKPSNYIYLYES